MMGLLKKERTISALWEGALKNNLNDIVLEALASSQTKGYLELTYEFVGWGAYLDSKKGRRATQYYRCEHEGRCFLVVRLVLPGNGNPWRRISAGLATSGVQY